MRKIFNKKGVLVEAQLEKGEQMWLMKENRRLIEEYDKNKTKVQKLSGRKGS